MKTLLYIYFGRIKDMQNRDYEQVTIVDDERAHIFPVGPTGLSSEDQVALAELVPAMKSGEIDTVNLVPVHGLLVTQQLEALVDQQLQAVIEADTFIKTDPIKRTGGGYTQLHVDGVGAIDDEGQRYSVNESGVRTHFTQGSSSRDANIPAGFHQSDLDPYFVIGRSSDYQTGPNGFTLSMQTFDPAVIIDMRSPIWTLFRNTGDIQGPNPPLAHTVVPKRVLDVMMDPGVEWSPLDENNHQIGTTDKGQIEITSDNYAPIAGIKQNISPDREFVGTDYVQRGIELDPR